MAIEKSRDLQEWSSPGFVLWIHSSLWRRQGRWQRQDRRIHWSFAPRLLRWCTPEETRRSWPGSLSPRPRPSATPVKQADRDDALTTPEREELSLLGRENRRLRDEREILAEAAAWFAREAELRLVWQFSTTSKAGTIPTGVTQALAIYPGRVRKEAPSRGGEPKRSSLPTKAG